MMGRKTMSVGRRSSVPHEAAAIGIAVVILGIFAFLLSTAAFVIPVAIILYLIKWMFNL